MAPTRHSGIEAAEQIAFGQSRMRKKLCVIDMNFTWPPDGGAPVNLLNMLSAYAEVYETTLLIPRLSFVHPRIRKPWPLNRTKFFLRGEVNFEKAPPFKIEFIDFGLSQFKPKTVGEKVRAHLEPLKPDHLFIADAWYFKPALIQALKDYHPVVRLYVHEMMCIKGNGLLYRQGKVCDVNYLDETTKSFATCVRCAVSFYATYPSPRWLMEFVRAHAFTRRYQKECVEAFNLARMVLVGNRFIADRLHPYIHTPVRVAPSGIDLGRFNISDTEVEPRERKQVLVLGRMEMKSKGLHVLVEACRRLWNRRKDFQLLTASRGSMPQEPFIEPLAWVSHKEVSRIYNGVDVVVIPSLQPEVLPQTGFEAMAFSLPVIGSNVGGIPEQIVDGVTGFLVPPGDAGKLAEKMEWVFDHPDEAKTMGRKGRERLEKEFVIEKVFERYYKDLFEPRTGKRDR
jgi:glycosyltransferase involved in cell wall biosynthesis